MRQGRFSSAVNRRHGAHPMASTVRIAILDDDHVTRLVRFALSGPGQIPGDFVHNFFAPEVVDPADIVATAHGLHAADGVSVIPMGAGPGTGRDGEAAILIFRRGRVDEAVMAAHPGLRLVQRIGERSDSIDLRAAAARGVMVSCLPRPPLRMVAEHTLMMMLALAKRLLAADAAVRHDRWDRDLVKSTDGVAYNWAGLQGIGGLAGKTLGIVGLGEVGTLVAPMARAFAMRVVYANRGRLPTAEEDKLGVDPVSLARLLAESDFVSLHAANLPENRDLFGTAQFAAMKPTAFFINTSRGRLVDEGALHEALTHGVIAGAALDVHAHEPRPQPDRLAALDKVILTPHCAGGSRRGHIQELEEIFANCRAVLTGGPVRHRVV